MLSQIANTKRIPNECQTKIERKNQSQKGTKLDPRTAENGPPMRCAECQMPNKHRTDSATTNKCGYNDHSQQRCEIQKEMSMNINIKRKCQ